MRAQPAARTHERLARLAAGDLAPEVGGRRAGRDPGAAAARGAVQPVLGRKLVVLAVPELAELIVEELVDFGERDHARRAAFGRHVRGVRDGHGEDAAQAGVAHVVFAGEEDGFGEGDVVVAAG